MNKIFKLLLLASLFATAGCIKQKNCDCSMSGSFVYLKEPYELWTGCSYEYQEIVAHFYHNDIISKWPTFITGNVPKKFQSHDTIRVSICCKDFCEKAKIVRADGYTIYRLTCIETED